MEQQMPKKKKKAKRFYDYSLLFCIIFLTAFGLVMIYSASSYSAQLSKAYNGNGAYFMQRQAGIAAVGLVAMLIMVGIILSVSRGAEAPTIYDRRRADLRVVRATNGAPPPSRGGRSSSSRGRR